MSNKEQDQCPYCHQKPFLYPDGSFSEYDSEIELAEGGWTSLSIGSDRNGNVVMRACGDDYTDDYYPKYCPECGRKLINQQGEPT